MRSQLIIFTLCLSAVPVLAESSPVEAAARFLQNNRVYQEKPTTAQADSDLRDQIAATRDPETKFGAVVFSLARKSGKLLTGNQAAQLDAIIKARQNSTVNWHDVRNIVRVHAKLALWDYALATDSDDIAKRKVVWQQWTNLRLAYMFEEFVAAERFQRAAWKLLSEKQKRNISSGEWDAFIKKSTGHAREFSAHKQVQKALGPPSRPEAFDRTAREWESRWVKVLDSYSAAARFQRQREFAMELADESFAVASWSEYDFAFRNFASAERDAIRDLVQGGYEVNQGLRSESAEYTNSLRFGMIKKYQANADSFLRQLGQLE